jgi:hypothetical protein
VVWRSPNLVSNHRVWILGDYLVTGYGFSDERDYLFVLNKWTGAVVQKLPLPKAPAISSFTTESYSSGAAATSPSTRS